MSCLVVAYHCHLSLDHFRDSLKVPGIHYFKEEDIFSISNYHVCLVFCAYLFMSSNSTREISRQANSRSLLLARTLLLWVAGVSTVHFGYYCKPKVGDPHILLITALAMRCAWLAFRRPQVSTLYVSYKYLGTSILTTVLHGLGLYGWARLYEMMPWQPLLVMVMLTLMGSSPSMATGNQVTNRKVVDISTLALAFEHLARLMQIAEGWDRQHAGYIC